MNRLALLLVLGAACAGRSHRLSERAGRPPPTTPTAAMHDAWIDAVGAKDRARVEAMLALPVWVYYDDGVTSVPLPACARWRRTLQQATTVAERSEIAACIVATAIHERVGDPQHPTGVVALAVLENLVGDPARARLEALGRDHVFVHGHSVGGSDFDFTLAVPATGGPADFVALTAEPGE